ncbi:MAG: OmpA family protein [Oleiphilaceae bacterium]|nr:OmpA family protein [Oleiphilaceae bacterium]
MMSQRGWVSTTLLIVLLLVIAAGGYGFYSYSQEQAQVDRALAMTESEIATLGRALATAEEDLAASRSLAEERGTRLQQSNDRIAELSLERDRLQAAQAEARGIIELANANDSQARRQMGKLRDERESLETKLAEVTAQLGSVEAERDQLQARLTGMQGKYDQALQEIEERTRELDSVEAELTEAEGQVTELQQAQAGMVASLELAREKLEQRRQDLAKVAKERQTAAQQYRDARERLALQQAKNQSFSETIAELEARLKREKGAMDSLQTQLQSLSNEKEALVSRLEDGTTVIKLPEDIVFDSGSARIGDAGQDTLQFLANALQSFPNHLVSIQGHSDSRAIAASLKPVYPSNWELSASRAASAVRVLKAAGITSGRMQAVGYADSRPLVEETDAGSRRANRRIEVLLYPEQFNVTTQASRQAAK